MIAGGSTIYCLDIERPSQVLPKRIDAYLGGGERADILCFDASTEKIVASPVEMVQLVSNEEDYVEIEIEKRIKLRLLPTALVLTRFGFKLADTLAPPMEIVGLPKGTELYDQFLFVYPKPSLYRVTAPAKAAGAERMFGITLPVPCCVVDGMVVKATEID